jgi:predicted alpha/beta superfamily hydrolase
MSFRGCLWLGVVLPWLGSGCSAPPAQGATRSFGACSAAAPLASNEPRSASALASAGAASARGYPLVELSGTELRELESPLTGKQHRLLIALPPSFRDEPGRRYPVLFVLDGQWDFPLVATLSGGLRFDQVLPELLIVGLSWGGEHPNYDALRADDYLPTRAKGHDGVEKGGGAPRFLAFLQESVFPLLEREYRADAEHRIIAGTSNGGLFALYALFEKPELFWGYVAISPNVGWDAQAIFARERAFHAAHPALERRVWLSSGSAEWPDYLARETGFFEQMKSSHYQGLALEVYDVPGERHAGVKPEAYNRALRFIAQPLLAAPR